ncbi:hypothetical protein Vretifemale_20254 [Volvox reticuliferus]|uniref:Uncharacterized protein n=1 Tax=Volvox reticuliferus TaxID=1737510 RepID=A0A8J4D0C7_9CHLO|nr:hypothetical protein Vretifemale_20254 [Volvox reticuliferus]
MDADGGGAGGGGRGTTSSGPSSASPFSRGQASAQVRLPAEVEVEVAETCLTLAAVGIIASARPLGHVGSDRGGVYGGDVRVPGSTAMGDMARGLGRRGHGAAGGLHRRRCHRAQAVQ